MNAMSLRSKSSKARAVVLALAAVLATASVIAAEAEKKDEQSQAETERKLEDARRRLDTAAREVAELSMSMSEHAVPSIRHFTRIGAPRAMLGINLGPRVGEDLPEGVTVASVSPGGAAESAGLKAGDVLLSIGDKQLKRDGDVSSRAVLMQAMSEVKPGDKVQLKYRRDKKVATATVTAQAPMDRIFATRPMAVRGEFTHASPFPAPLAMMRAIGVFGSAELVPLTPKLGQYFGTEKGLLVVRAPADSRLKLEDGDVIVDIDGRTPSNPTHAFRILGSYQAGEELKLGVLRMKKRMTFEVTVPDDPVAAAAVPFGLGFTHDDSLMPFPEAGVRGRDEIILKPAMPAMPLTPLFPPPPPPGEPGEVRTITIQDEPA
ncbi:MAG: PDZ domain-containing protein [Steroidobacter sp.]